MNPTAPTLVAVLGGHGDAPFDRAQVVVRLPGGGLLQVDRWVGGAPQGTALTEEDLEGLVRAEEARRCPEAPVVDGMVYAWHLGAGFVLGHAAFEAEVHEAGGLLTSFRLGDRTVLVVREGKAGFLRTAVFRQAEGEARHSFSVGHYRAAANEAMNAWLLAPRGDAAVVALLVAALEASGQPERATGYRALERNSYGAAFDVRVGAELKDLKPSARTRMRVLSQAANCAALAG